jgi:hypothetical protein
MMRASSGVNAPLAAILAKWLTNSTGEQPKMIREEPPDQMPAALAQAAHLVALMTEQRAILAQAEGLVYRPLVPAPVIEYGFAYVRDNQSAALANLLEIVAKVAPPLEGTLPEGRELLFSGTSPAEV